LKGLSVHERVDATLGKNHHYFYWYMHWQLHLWRSYISPFQFWDHRL